MLDRSRDGATRASLEATNAVAAAYWRAGRYPDARELLERVLADCRAALGPRDPDTLVVEGNLAVTHICLEHFEHGLDLLVGNVEARAAVLGDTHPHTMVARHALATAYHMADLLPDALALFAGVAAQRARTLGPAHPDALVSRIGLALARIDSGDDAGAVAVLAAALQDAEQSVGSLDELTVTIRSNLAHGHAALGRPDLARAELERAATDCQTLLGENHPDTVALRADLALLSRDGVLASRRSRAGRAPRRACGDPAPQRRTLRCEAGPPGPGRVWRGRHPAAQVPGEARNGATLPAGIKRCHPPATRRAGVRPAGATGHCQSDPALGLCSPSAPAPGPCANRPYPSRMLRRVPRPTFGPLAGRRSRAQARRIAPAALVRLGGPEAAGWRLGEPFDGRGDTNVFAVRADGGSPALLKATGSRQGRLQLERQVRVLAALHDDPRLGPWARLVPRTLGAGEVDGLHFVLESRLPGADCRRLPEAERARVIPMALETIADLQARTGSVAAVDADVLDRWVREPAAHVRDVVRGTHRAALDALQARLVAELSGRAVARGLGARRLQPDQRPARRRPGERGRRLDRGRAGRAGRCGRGHAADVRADPRRHRARARAARVAGRPGAGGRRGERDAARRGGRRESTPARCCC